MSKNHKCTEEELRRELSLTGNISEVFRIYSEATDLGYESLAEEIIAKAQSFLPEDLGLVKKP